MVRRLSVCLKLGKLGFWSVVILLRSSACDHVIQAFLRMVPDPREFQLALMPGLVFGQRSGGFYPCKLVSLEKIWIQGLLFRSMHMFP